MCQAPRADEVKREPAARVVADRAPESDRHAGQYLAQDSRADERNLPTTTQPRAHPPQTGGGIPKSRKRQQAELKAQLRAKRNSSSTETKTTTTTTTTSLGPDTHHAKELLRAATCPHLARWLSEDDTEGITWDFESFYRASDTYVLEDQVSLPDALAFLLQDRGKNQNTVIAIDLEWQPDRLKTDNNPVALIQLATTTRCVLIRTVDWDTSGRAGLPGPLHDFLSSSPDRLFLGFSWDGGDEKKFRSSFGVGRSVFSAFVDLQELAQVLGYGKKCGLAWLTREVVGAELPKSIARSNWARSGELSAEQVAYGALDAFSLHAIVAGWRLMQGG
jgi:hypothetical protein